ncbi:MAG: stage II sporulation protein M [Candidatus Cohnella colombiensis]|uniref:Stage II sporulation protein M n=1 Tax=Candidatus Cohnella colombiensis TaxID=3121368 RepID=A0AA95F637_9BACL|nr:MAG: stage II sporulation protein M [Cohnella sp.]
MLRVWNLSARNNVHLYVFVGVLIVVGAIFGVLLTSALTLEQQQELSEQLNVYMSGMSSDSSHAAVVFWDRFFFYGKWLLLIWLLGISVIGLPVVLLLDFIKGVLIGFSAGILIQQFAWKGVLLFLASTAIQNAILIPVLIIATVSASRFAYFIVRERLFRRKGQMMPPFLAHCAVTVFMLLFICGVCCYEAFVSPLLLGWV